MEDDNENFEEFWNLLMEENIENFEEVWNDSRFKILNYNIKDILFILSSDKLKNGRQQTVWQVIHDWVITNKKNRLKHFPKLLKENLQFDRLTKHFVEYKIFKNALFLLLPINFQTDLKNYVKNVIFQNEHNSMNIGNFNLPSFSPDIHYQKLFCINIENGYTEYYDHQHNIWISPSESIQLSDEQKYFRYALLGEKLYAFGGIDKNENSLDSMWSLDKISNSSSEWTAKANMIQNRSGFPCVVLNEAIYALGGWSKKNESPYYYLRSCERYSSELNQWSMVADMLSKRVGASAAIFSGQIFVAGGWISEEKTQRSVEKYYPQADVWIEVAPMTIARTDFALISFAGRLWAIGGLGDQPLASVESYSTETDSWREEAPLKERRWRHAAIEFNDELYVVGGSKNFKKENIFSWPVDPIVTVEKYVPNEGWITSSALQKGFPHASLISVPPVQQES